MSGLIYASILKPELANSLAEGYRQSGEERHKREIDRENGIIRLEKENG